MVPGPNSGLAFTAFRGRSALVVSASDWWLVVRIRVSIIVFFSWAIHFAPGCISHQMVAEISQGGGIFTVHVHSCMLSTITLPHTVISHGVKTPQRLKYGENGTIELAIFAYPSLKYEWHKDGKHLEFPSERIAIDPYSGTLSIIRVERGDEGNYTCRVVWKANRTHEETEDTVAIEVLVVGEFYIMRF